MSESKFTLDVMVEHGARALKTADLLTLSASQAAVERVLRQALLPFAPATSLPSSEGALAHGIPAMVMAPFGPVRVAIVPNLHGPHGDAVRSLWGQYSSETRLIELCADMPAWRAWATFYHELMHAWLLDSGVHLAFTDAQAEMLCETVALGRVCEAGQRAGE